MTVTQPEMKFGVVGDAMHVNVVGSTSTASTYQDIELRAIEEGHGHGQPSQVHTQHCDHCCKEGSHRAAAADTKGADGAGGAGAGAEEDDAAPGALEASPIEDDGEPTGEFTGDMGEMDETGKMPKMLKKAKEVLTTGHSDVVKKYYKGDPALGVPAFPQAPVCDVALQRAELSVKSIQGYDESVHTGCKWLMGCMTCLPACLGVSLMFVADDMMGGLAELVRCLCWMPSIVAHTHAEASIKVSKITFKDFKGLGQIEKIDMTKNWLNTTITSAFLGLKFGKNYPDKLISDGLQMNTIGMLLQVGLPAIYLISLVVFELGEISAGAIVMAGALGGGLVNMCISLVIFKGLGKVGKIAEKSRLKLEAGCNCRLDCEKYYEAGGAEGLAESKLKVGSEVKKIREATKVVQKFKTDTQE